MRETTRFTTHITTLTKVAMVINNDGAQASGWYSDNFLQGNLSKYQAMVISNDVTQQDVEISDSFTAQPLDELNLLRVVIDRNLSFSQHISTVTACKKASIRVGVLMRMRNVISIKAKLSMYKTAILPYLTYCNLVWHFCKGSDKRKLERVNERGLRAVFCDWRSPYSELLSRARMTSLYNSRLQDIAIFMYKFKFKLLPTNISY